jgi:hypothetical protein
MSGALDFSSSYRRRAGIAEIDPDLRGCNPIDKKLDQRLASFEASLREAPHDEDFS